MRLQAGAGWGELCLAPFIPLNPRSSHQLLAVPPGFCPAPPPPCCLAHLLTLKWGFRGFPGGAVVKNPPAKAGDTGSSPGPGGSHMLQSN